MALNNCELNDLLLVVDYYLEKAQFDKLSIFASPFTKDMLNREIKKVRHLRQRIKEEIQDATALARQGNEP